MRDELLTSHSTLQCFTLAFKVYRIHFVPIVILFSLLIAPSFISSTLGLPPLVNTIFFFIATSLGEAAAAMGLFALMFQSFFPAFGILRVLKSKMIFGFIQIEILRRTALLSLGVMSVVSPTPLNLLLLSLLCFLFIAWPLAQMIFIATGEVGFNALKSSFHLVKLKLPKTIMILLCLGAITVALIFIFISYFLPDVFNEVQSQTDLDPEAIQTIQNTLLWIFYLEFILITPFSGLVKTLLYLDIATENSKFSLDTLQQRLAFCLTPTTEPQSVESEPTHPTELEASPASLTDSNASKPSESEPSPAKEASSDEQATEPFDADKPKPKVDNHEN